MGFNRKTASSSGATGRAPIFKSAILALNFFVLSDHHQLGAWCLVGTVECSLLLAFSVLSAGNCIDFKILKVGIGAKKHLRIDLDQLL